MTLRLYMLLAGLILWGTLAAVHPVNAGADDEMEAHYGTFTLPGFQCTIGDNTAADPHMRGYNGIFSLLPSEDGQNVFVPLFSGLNLEHYFDALPVTEPGSVFFEPRRAAMQFTRIDEHTAELYQPVTPVFGVESRTRFTATAPHYIDMHFSCTPHRSDLAGGLLGIFWASYMNAPEDKSIYFLGDGSSLESPRWIQFCTQEHNRDSTVCSENDRVNIAFQGTEKTLFTAISPLRYAVPFFYGRIREQVLIYIFQPGPLIRFAHSPSGAGATEKGDDTNPAWDFQMIIPDCEPGTSYTLDMRLVCKKWQGRDDVLEEVRRFLSGTDK